MPIPQIIRIDPRDLNKNKAVGISLPFNGGGVFVNTFSTKDQIKSNLINLLLTYKGERILNPEFGADLPRLLFEVISDETYIKIQDQIISSIATYIPEITLTNIELIPTNSATALKPPRTAKYEPDDTELVTILSSFSLLLSNKLTDFAAIPPKKPDAPSLNATAIASDKSTGTTASTNFLLLSSNNNEATVPISIYCNGYNDGAVGGFTSTSLIEGI